MNELVKILFVVAPVVFATPKWPRRTAAHVTRPRDHVNDDANGGYDEYH